MEPIQGILFVIHEASPKKFTIDMHIFRNISGIDVEHILRKLHPEILI